MQEPERRRKLPEYPTPIVTLEGNVIIKNVEANDEMHLCGILGGQCSRRRVELDPWCVGLLVRTHTNQLQGDG